MTEGDRIYIRDLIVYLQTLNAKGVERAGAVMPAPDPNHRLEETAALAFAFNPVLQQLHQAYAIYTCLANGDLSHEIPSTLYLAMPAKALQSGLKHLTWQTQRIAQGDLNQTVHFMGAFSDAFNQLVDALRTRHALEQEIIAAANRLKTITSVLGDGVMVTDTAGVITFCNPEACTLTGHAECELLGTGFHERIHRQHRDGKTLLATEQPLNACIALKQVIRHDDIAFTKKDGTLFPVSASFAPISQDDGGGGAVIAFRDISRQIADHESLWHVNQMLEKQATTDMLTGLRNRQFFDRQLVIEIERATRYPSPLSFIIFDIDRFKSINDTFGHLCGDNVLKGIAAAVRDSIRKLDILARWGGEEFAVLLPGGDAAAARATAEKLRLTIEAHAFPLQRSVTCSFGVSEFVPGDTPEQLTARADDAMYAAKAAGRNQVVVAGNAPVNQSQSG